MTERIWTEANAKALRKKHSISYHNDSFQSIHSPVDRILYLQNIIGNQTVHRLMKSGALQAKLRIGAPGDVYEQQVDKVAEQIMKISQPRKEEEEETLPKKEVSAHTPEVTQDFEGRINGIRGGGQPLPESVHAFFETRFGQDFSSVRVHTDAMAAEATKAVNARAFTMGKDVVFGEGQYSPVTGEGKRLLAHELTHVLQQETGHIHPVRSSMQISEVKDSAGQKPKRTINALTSMTQPHSLARFSRSFNADAIQRQPSLAAQTIQQPPSGATNALFALGGGNDFQNMMDVMTAVQSVRPSDVASGLYTTAFKGKTITLTPAQRDQLNAAAKAAIKKNLGQAKRDADYAKSGYDIQKEINEKQWFVSAVVVTFAGVRSKGHQLEAEVKKAEISAAATENALQANNFLEAGRRLAECEMAAKQARTLWREYHEGIIGAGEKTVTVLEYTRDASFITLGVLAIIATGGAAAAGTGAVTTTTAFGIEVGTVSAANVIATGAPIVATLGSAGMQAALGDKVDWTRVGIDVAVNLILSRFGGKVSNTIFTRMMGNSSVRSIGAIAFGRIFSSLMTHELSTAFTTSVDATYRKLKGQNVTWDQFSDELVERLLDPKGLVVAGIMGAVVAGADVKLGGARGVEIVDKKGSPLGEIDEIRAGVIRERKSAQGIGTINPKTGKPFPGSDESTWAQKQIYGKTKTRIENLKVADATRPSGRMSEDPVQAAGSSVYPNIKELQTIRKLEFRIDADTPGLRAQVEIQINRLRTEFSDWTFTATYGK